MTIRENRKRIWDEATQDLNSYMELGPDANGFIEKLLNRRTVRRYKKGYVIPEEHVKAILEAGRRAPSWGSLHLYSIIRVREHTLKEELAKTLEQYWFLDASEIFIVAADIYRLSRIMGHLGISRGDNDFALILSSIIDATLAAAYMSAMAELLGYGTGFIGLLGAPYIPKLMEFMDLVRIPRKVYPLMVLAVGVAEDSSRPRPRLPLNMLVHNGAYKRYTSKDLDQAVSEMDSILQEGGYKRVLINYVSAKGLLDHVNEVSQKLLIRQGFMPPIIWSRSRLR